MYCESARNYAGAVFVLFSLGNFDTANTETQVRSQKSAMGGLLRRSWVQKISFHLKLERFFCPNSVENQEKSLLLMLKLLMGAIVYPPLLDTLYYRYSCNLDVTQNILIKLNKLRLRMPGISLL